MVQLSRDRDLLADVPLRRGADISHQRVANGRAFVEDPPAVPVGAGQPDAGQYMQVPAHTGGIDADGIGERGRRGRRGELTQDSGPGSADQLPQAVVRLTARAGPELPNAPRPKVHGRLPFAQTDNRRPGRREQSAHQHHPPAVELLVVVDAGRPDQQPVAVPRRDVVGAVEDGGAPVGGLVPAAVRHIGLEYVTLTPYKTADGGKTHEFVIPPDPNPRFITPFEGDPKDPDQWVAGSQVIWDNQGKGWE